MGLSNSEQRKLAYFHSLNKSMTEGQQNIYESNYRSSHNIRTNDIWCDNIPFASNYTIAKNLLLSNNSYTLFEKVFLTEVYGSNGQAYVYIRNGKFKDNSYPLSERGYLTKIDTMSPVEPEYIRPFISPEDVVDTTTNESSIGYTLRLFREDDTEIFLTEGSWVVNYNSGIIYFSEGYTPSDMGWGEIKASFFQYTGKFLNDQLYDMNRDNITGVTFNNNVLYFKQQDGDIIQIDLSNLSNGFISKMSSSNINMVSLQTSSGNTLASSVPLLSSNVPGSTVIVFINGVQVNLGDDDTCDCYFSNDGGVSKKSLTNIIVGDYLYWNYDINGVPLSGYHLSNSDRISFNHLTP